MKLTYENQGTIIYLSCELSEEQVDTLTLGMITNNQIPGFAQAVFTQIDEQKFIKYNISSKVSLKQYLSGNVTKKRLLTTLEGITDAMLNAEDYMIEQKSILLDMEQIYVDVSTGAVAMICVPILDCNQNAADVNFFFKNIMFTTQFEPTEHCEYIPELINYLNRTSSGAGFSLTSFKELLKRLQQDPASAAAMPAQQAAPVQQPAPMQQTVPAQQAAPVPQTANVQQMPAQQPTAQQPAPMQQPAPQGGKVQQPKTQIPAQPVKGGAKNSQTPGMAVPGMAVPGQKNNAPAEKKQNAAAGGAKEENISLFYLLQHYNKENAAAYKAQKESAAANKQQKDKSSGKKKKNAAAPAPAGVPVPPMAGQNGVPVPGNGNVPRPNAANVQPNVPRPNSAPAAAQGNAPMMGMPQNPTPVQPAVPTQQPVPMQQPVPQNHANFGETVVLNQAGNGETTVLSSGMMIYPFLLRRRNQEKIMLDKPVFRIGKERSYVDYFIADNTAVSRSHANIITKDGKYYIVDTNSTNHTFINGQMIPSNVETELTNGASIRLANEEFEFRTF